MELKMEVYSPALELLGLLETHRSILWEERAFTAGSFSLEALITEHSKALLIPENILWIAGETAGMIEYVHQQVSENGPVFTVKGRDLTGILERRILWGRYDLSGTPSAIMRRLVDDCCIHPTRGSTEARKIPGLLIPDTPPEGETIRIQKTGGSLLEALEQLGETYGVAFGIRFNPQVPQMEFWTRSGIDRTVQQSAEEPVFYSTELDDVLSSEYLFDSGDYRNVSLVAGEGEGADRVFITVEQDTKPAPPDAPAPPEPEYCTISLTVEPEGGGIVSGGGSFAAGESVTVIASPAGGYTFTGWKEDGEIISGEASFSFRVQKDRNLTAVFAAEVRTYTITVQIDPAGGGTVTGGGTYQEGETVSIQASANDGYDFSAMTEGGQTIGTSAILSFLAEHDRTITVVFTAKPASRLPEGYAEVEYIESSGTQYVDAKIKPVRTTRIIMDVEPTVAGSSNQKYFFDSHYFITSGTKYVFRMQWDNGGVKACMGAYSSITNTTVNSNTNLRRMSLEMDVSQKTASVDGVPKTFSSNSISISLSNIILLTYNKSNTYAISAKLYSCRIYTGDDLMRNFIPCKNPSGIAGLYDLVNGEFYASNGTDAFIAGPTI